MRGCGGVPGGSLDGPPPLRQFVFSTAENVALNQTIPNWIAYGVTVDNLSSSWAFVPEAGRFVPPWTATWSAPLAGTKNAILSWQAPSGITVPTPGSGHCTLTFTDAAVPFNPGVVVVQAQPLGVATPPVTNTVTNLAYATGSATNLAPNATVVVVAGIPNKTVIVYGFWWNFCVVTSATTGLYAGQITDTTGVTFLDLMFANSLSGVGSIHAERAMPIAGGVAMPKGAGLLIQNSPASAGNISIAGSFAYTQS